MTFVDVGSADILLWGLAPELSRFGRFVVNGVVVGSILALAGVGLTLVYGILRIANFAHGDFLTLGAYVTLYLVALVSLPRALWMGIAVAFVLVLLVAADRWFLPWYRNTRRNQPGSSRDESGTHGVGDGARVLSPTESGLLLFAAAGLLVLVAGIRLSLAVSAGWSLLVVTAIAAGPLLIGLIKDSWGTGLPRGTIAGWGLVGLAAGLAAHFLVPLQTGPGGWPLTAEVATGVMAFAAGVFWRHPGIVQRRWIATFLVAAALGFLLFFSHRVLLALVVSLAAVAVFLVLLELVVWRRARRQGAGLLTLIIIAIGLMLALRNSINILWGTGQRTFPGTLRRGEPILQTDILITPNQSLAVVVTLAVILAMHLLLQHTRMGKAMRALADDMELARVSGINVDRVVVYVWIIAGALAVIAGTLYGMVRPFDSNLGWFQILPIFAAVILGGIGSPYGAMIGGFIIGIAMEASPYFGVPVEYKLAVAFVVLILVMVFRPKGIMGGQATR